MCNPFTLTKLLLIIERQCLKVFYHKLHRIIELLSRYERIVSTYETEGGDVIHVVIKAVYNELIRRYLQRDASFARRAGNIPSLCSRAIQLGYDKLP